MNKKYTKKQITEAIAYWKKQLARGNYRKVNESEIRSFDDVASEWSEFHDTVVTEFGEPLADGSFDVMTDEGPFTITMDELRDDFGEIFYLGNGTYKVN